MTENLSFFDESSSNMPQTNYVDRLAEPSWPAFLEAAKDAEATVVIYDPMDEEACKKVNQHAIDLSEQFGWEYSGGRSTVLGLAYSAYYENSTVSEPVFINTDSATFHGVDLCFVDGRWQAMLEFYCHEDTEEVPSGTYHIPPDRYHLMTLKIDLPDDAEDDSEEIGLLALLQQDVESTHAFVRCDDFTTSEPQQQRMFLSDIIDSIDGDIPRQYLDRQAVISCTKYYTVFDDIPTFATDDFTTDLGDVPADQYTALAGMIQGFTYPELQALPDDAPLSTKMLTLNDGAYCLVLRNDDLRVTHYICPQTITEVI